MTDLTTRFPNSLSPAGGRRSFLQRSAMAFTPLAVAGMASSVSADEDDSADVAARRADDGKAAITARPNIFRSIRAHENDHVAFLVSVLGNDARPKPAFTGLQQDNVADFMNLARIFENVGVSAYLGALPFIFDQNTLAASGSIATVEARHAGVLNVYLDRNITMNNESFDEPMTAAEVNAAVAPFIRDLNGGPPVTYGRAPSDANDVRILNFALALEYLEATFYNANVNRFF